MPTSSWYSKIKKPNWAPPAYLFGPVWMILYIIIFISFGQVLIMGVSKEITILVMLPFIFNLIFNFSFTYFQFKLQNNILASIDIILVLITIIWMMISIYPYLPWVAYVQIPYLLWVGFATALQLKITYLNK